jgi:hypothetical protein
MNIVHLENKLRGKCEIWNEKRLPGDECQQKVFRHLNQEDVPLKNTSTVAEFLLSLPGTRAAVESFYW